MKDNFDNSLKFVLADEGNTMAEFHKELTQNIAYDPATGVFSWLKSGSGRKLNRPVGCLDGEGYRIIGFKRKYYKAHRLAWFHVHGRWPSEVMDHINQKTDDNRIINLREATTGQNRQNAKKLMNGNPKGTTYNKKRGAWKATICANGRSFHLGYFLQKEVAAQAYCDAAKKHFGEFARW